MEQASYSLQVGWAHPRVGDALISSGSAWSKQRSYFGKVEMGEKKMLNIQRCSLAPLCISNVESKEQELVSFQGFMLVLDTVSKPRTLDVPGLTFVLTWWPLCNCYHKKLEVIVGVCSSRPQTFHRKLLALFPALYWTLLSPFRNTNKCVFVFIFLFNLHSHGKPRSLSFLKNNIHTGKFPF